MRFCCVLTLSFILHINEAKWTQLMESLQCINDYHSFVLCTWSERQDVQKLIKMNLFYMTDESVNFEQMTCGSRDMDSESWKWNCYRNQSIFDAFMHDKYTFKPEQKLEVQLNVSLFDNVQPPPPKELSVTLTEEDDFLLKWKAGGRIRGNNGMDETLDYEVTYKRSWEPWERSTSVFVSNISYCLLRRGDLVSGSTYTARVRSKPHQDGRPLGHYSEWSSAVNWTVQEGNEAQPKKLRCLFNGIDQLNCSWEVRRELTSSVFFALFYKVSPESLERQCSPVVEQELADTLHVRQSCKIHVTNPERVSQYLVSVRPQEEEKMNVPVKNIKVDPPVQLSVIKLKSQLYQLQWNKTESEAPVIYQVLYWEAGETPEKPQNISEDVSKLAFTFQHLKPGTLYKAKMRAKAGARGLDYDGQWSKWSEEYEWVTESELPFWGFFIAVPICIILATVGVYCSQKYLVRKKREWEKNIPSPPRTFLLPGYFMNVQLPESFEESHRQSSLEEEVSNSSNALDRQLLVIGSHSLGAESGKTKPLSDVFQNMETSGFYALKADQCLRQAVPSPALACHHKARVGLTQQVFDFNGPYLMSLQGLPGPDVQEDVAPLEARETVMSMQYVELPHESRSRVLAVEKDNGTVPPFCAVQSEEEKTPLLKKQEGTEDQSASGILEEEENKGRRPPIPTSTNHHSENGILDYFTTEDVSRNTARDSVPILAWKEKMLTCATKSKSASHLPQTKGGPSNPELCLKKPDTVSLPKEQAPIVPSEISQDMFGEYFMTLPGAPGCVPKQADALSTKDPGQNKSFLVFNPDGKSPIFLRQVGEYCFFPSTKTITKTQEGSIGHQLTKDRKPPSEGKFVETELQTTSPVC